MSKSKVVYVKSWEKRNWKWCRRCHFFPRGISLWRSRFYHDKVVCKMILGSKRTILIWYTCLNSSIRKSYRCWNEIDHPRWLVRSQIGVVNVIAHLSSAPGFNPERCPKRNGFQNIDKAGQGPTGQEKRKSLVFIVQRNINTLKKQAHYGSCPSQAPCRVSSNLAPRCSFSFLSWFFLPPTRYTRSWWPNSHFLLLTKLSPSTHTRTIQAPFFMQGEAVVSHFHPLSPFCTSCLSL